MALIVISPEISSISSGIRGENGTKLFRRSKPRSSNTFRSSIGKEKIGIRVRVCASIKDCEVKVSDFEENIRLSRQFSAPVKRSSSPSKQNKADQEKQNYYVNTGYAIRTLREEFPELFYRELSLDIYRDDIVFKDPLNTFVGIDNYKSIFWALRFNGRIFFKALWVDIISVWQPVESVIMVRWTAHGIPRVPWESRGRFDGTSKYKLDKNGKIYEHRVENIALNSPPKFQVLSVEELVQSLSCPSTAKPTFFEISSYSVMKPMPFLMNAIWIRYYLAFTITFAWKYAAGARQKIFNR